MNSIYIYGASGHGLVVADIAKSCGYNDIMFIDDGDNSYLSFKDIKNSNHIPIAFGVGNNQIRFNLYEKVKSNGFKILTLIHPSAVVSPSAKISEGTIIMPNVVVNSNVTIGQGVILNSASVVEHESIIGDFVHISPCVALAGNTNVGDYTHIGIGSQTIQGITIGKNCIIGAGSTIVKNINDKKKAFGTPCKEIEDIK